MPYNEKLADRVREALAGERRVEEKKMFRGVCFMVNGKMCICIGHDELMVRIDPEKQEEAQERNGVRPMIRNGKPIKGYVYVGEEGTKSKRDFDHWVRLALEFNKEAKASKKSKPKKK